MRRALLRPKGHGPHKNLVGGPWCIQTSQRIKHYSPQQFCHGAPYISYYYFAAFYLYIEKI